MVGCCGLGASDSGYGAVAGSCENGDGLVGSTKGGDFFLLLE